MKRKICFLLILLLLVTTACAKKEDSKESEKKNAAAVDFAIRVDLFNSLEKLTKQLEDLKYKDALKLMEEVYELSNKVGLIYDYQDNDLKIYIDTINMLTDAISDEADKQKTNEIKFAYEKSMLKLIAEMDSAKEKKDDKSSEESKGGDEGSANPTEGEESGGGNGEDSKDGSGEEKKEESEVIIPEEEMVKKYPELAATKKDDMIRNQAIELMDFVTKDTLDKKPDNDIARLNRQKYLFYRLESLAKLEEFNSATSLIPETENNWEKLAPNIPEESKKEVLAINSSIKNISTSLNQKRHVPIKVQVTAIIKLLDELSNKLK